MNIKLPVSKLLNISIMSEYEELTRHEVATMALIGVNYVDTNSVGFRDDTGKYHNIEKFKVATTGYINEDISHISMGFGIGIIQDEAIDGDVVLPRFVKSVKFYQNIEKLTCENESTLIYSGGMHSVHIGSLVIDAQGRTVKVLNKEAYIDELILNNEAPCILDFDSMLNINMIGKINIKDNVLAVYGGDLHLGDVSSEFTDEEKRLFNIIPYEKDNIFKDVELLSDEVFYFDFNGIGRMLDYKNSVGMRVYKKLCSVSIKNFDRMGRTKWLVYQ